MRVFSVAILEEERIDHEKLKNQVGPGQLKGPTDILFDTFSPHLIIFILHHFSHSHLFVWWTLLSITLWRYGIWKGGAINISQSTDRQLLG